MSKMCAFALSLLTASAAAPQPLDERIRVQADAAVSAVADRSTPGLAAAIVRDGGVIWQRYLGMADLDHGIPIGPQSRFYLGSLTKPLIAATVLSLAAEGALSVEDSLDRWWPESPSWASRVTIRQLLSMTSGVRDYLKLRDLAGEPKDGFFDNDTALEILQRQNGLAFEPGSRYKYSNSNYVLLAEIVARVTGQAAEEVVRDRVREPLGMRGALLESDYTLVVPSRVTSYRLEEAGVWHRYLKNFSSLGDGGGWATLDDLLALDRWIAGSEGLAPDILETMLEPARLNDGLRGEYGAGLLVRDWRGLPAIEHGGFMLGFQHLYLHLPEHRVSVVLLTNNREIAPFELRDRLLEIALGTSAPEPAKEPEERGQPSDAATGFDPDQPLPTQAPGCYWNEEVPVGIEISVRDGALLMRPTSFRELPLERIGPLRFTVGGMQIEFVADAEDAVQGLNLISDDFGGLPFDRVPAERCESDS